MDRCLSATVRGPCCLGPKPAPPKAPPRPPPHMEVKKESLQYQQHTGIRCPANSTEVPTMYTRVRGKGKKERSGEVYNEPIEDGRHGELNPLGREKLYKLNRYSTLTRVPTLS